MPVSLRLSRMGITTPLPDEERRLRQDFERNHVVCIEDFFEPALLSWLQAALLSAQFVTRIHQDLTPPAIDTALDDPALHAKLFVLLNDSALFRTVEAVSGCDPIGCFAPVVLRQDPGEPHHDSWHSDVDGNRLVALSVNVGDAFEGSALQIRERGSGEILFSQSNAIAGSALLFRIAPTLEHCTAPLEGDTCRTVLVGWFQRRPVAGPNWPATLAM